MNRHFFTDHLALPTEPLGTPIRPEPEKPRDGEWKPLRPGYESRTLAGGATEVRCTSLPTQPAKKPADPPSASAVSAPAAALDPAVDVPEGATHRMLGANGTFYRAVGAHAEYWCHSGRWVRSALSAHDLNAASSFERLPQPAAPTEWQSGPPPSVGFYLTAKGTWEQCTPSARFWNGYVWSLRIEDIRCFTVNMSDREALDVGFWRGPRLTGEAWPEPQQ